MLGPIREREVPATLEALKVLRARVDSEAVHAETVWRRVEPIGLRAQELECRSVAALALQAPELLDERPAVFAAAMSLKAYWALSPSASSAPGGISIASSSSASERWSYS